MPHRRWRPVDAPMIFLLANTVFLILSVGYGWLAGDRLDRQAAAWIVAALAGTLAATIYAASHQVLAILAVDVVLLAAIVRIALRSPRYWPIWFAGLHLAGVACLFAASIAPSQHVETLRTFAGFWGVPALLAMVFGLFLDRRAEARAKAYAQPST